MLRRILASVGLSGIILFATAIQSAAQIPAEQPALVRVDEVRTEPLEQTVPVIGRFVALQSGAIAAQVEGPVVGVLVQVGDRVEIEDPLAMLDTEELTLERDLRAAQVDAAQAALASAQSGVKIAQQELDRLEQLKRSGSAAFPRARYDDAAEETVRAQREVTRARALLSQAQSQAKLAEINLERAVIRAPYPGVVTMRHTAAGAWLKVGDPVVDMVNDIDLEIEADVPSDRVAGLLPGVEVSARLADGSKHVAVVRAVVTDENPLTRTRPVRFVPRVDSTEKRLAVNESVTIGLPIGVPRDVISVHKDAIVNRQGKTFVFVVRGDESAMRPVILGEATGGRFEVRQGLRPGELVVVRGNERLRPGQKVQVKPTPDS